jgi:hypothetical protein
MKYLNHLPEEIINKIYAHYFHKYILKSQELKDQIFKLKLRKMSFKQRRDLALYHQITI